MKGGKGRLQKILDIVKIVTLKVFDRYFFKLPLDIVQVIIWGLFHFETNHTKVEALSGTTLLQFCTLRYKTVLPIVPTARVQLASPLGYSPSAKQSYHFTYKLVLFSESVVVHVITSRQVTQSF